MPSSVSSCERPATALRLPTIHHRWYRNAKAARTPGAGSHPRVHCVAPHAEQTGAAADESEVRPRPDQQGKRTAAQQADDRQRDRRRVPLRGPLSCAGGQAERHGAKPAAHSG